MGIKTIKFIWSFQNFKCSSSLFYWNFHTQSLSSYPIFLFTIWWNLSFSFSQLCWWPLCTGRSVMFALLSVLFPFPWCALFLQSSKHAIFFVTMSEHSGWQDHQSKMIFVSAFLSVWLRLSVSLEKAHSCKVLENSCSANTDSRRTGDILGHFKFTPTKCNFPRTCNLLWVENNDRTKQKHSNKTKQNKSLEQSLESKQWSNYFLKRQEQM